MMDIRLVCKDDGPSPEVTLRLSKRFTFRCDARRFRARLLDMLRGLTDEEGS